MASNTGGVITHYSYIESLDSRHDSSRVQESWDQAARILQYIAEEALTEADREHFIYFLWKMSSTLPEQKQADNELRLLTNRSPSFKAFGESLDAIPQLLYPLSQSKSGSKFTKTSKKI